MGHKSGFVPLFPEPGRFGIIKSSSSFFVFRKNAEHPLATPKAAYTLTASVNRASIRRVLVRLVCMGIGEILF